MKTALFLKCVASNGSKNFNIFLNSNSTHSKSLPRGDPRTTQAEIEKNKIPNSSEIPNVRCTRSGNWIFSTIDRQVCYRCMPNHRISGSERQCPGHI